MQPQYLPQVGGRSEIVRYAIVFHKLDLPVCEFQDPTMLESFRCKFFLMLLYNFGSLLFLACAVPLYSFSLFPSTSLLYCAAFI